MKNTLEQELKQIRRRKNSMRNLKNKPDREELWMLVLSALFAGVTIGIIAWSVILIINK
jgi:preprotein translocase subunit Sss1